MHTSSLPAITESALNPQFITGFVDAEGCFYVGIHKVPKATTGYSIKISFQIGLHRKDLLLLEKIKSFFGVGIISRDGENCVKYQVRSIEDLKIVVGHFDKYSLITQKQADFLLFKSVFELMCSKQHLTEEGLLKIAALKASMNKGLSEQLKVAFSNVIPVNKSSVLNNKVKDPNWLVGFIVGEGCFLITVQNSTTRHNQVRLVFQLTQHQRDERLMMSLIEYFGCGNVYQSRNAIDFRITKFKDLEDKLIPFFDKYPLQGVKYLDYLIFAEVVELMKNKAHLTKEGLAQIIKIKARLRK